MPAQFADRVSFVVPATSGQYAPEVLHLEPLTAGVPAPSLLGLTVLIESLPASAAVEIWLLKRGGDPTTSADHFLYKSITASDTLPLASYAGAQLRVKSGGTSGTAIVDASAD